MGHGTEYMESYDQSFITSNTQKDRTRQAVWRTSGQGHQTSSNIFYILFQTQIPYSQKGNTGGGAGLMGTMVTGVGAGQVSWTPWLQVWDSEDNFILSGMSSLPCGFLGRCAIYQGQMFLAAGLQYLPAIIFLRREQNISPQNIAAVVW